MNEGFLDDSSPTVNADHPDCQLLGGLVVQGQQGTCTPFASGDNYLTEQDAGRLSTGCNRNFIRDDALLIVVMLTDENDSSEPDEQQWFDALWSPPRASRRTS